MHNLKDIFLALEQVLPRVKGPEDQYVQALDQFLKLKPSEQPGDMVIRMDPKAETGARIARYRVAPQNSDAAVPSTIGVYPDGGGFALNLPLTQFYAQFRAPTLKELEPPLVRAAFGLDDGTTFQGWHYGLFWNGWAIPLFETPEFERFLAWLGESESYLVERISDTHVRVTSEDDPEDVYDCELKEYPDGQKLWSPPEGWCWELIED